MYCYLEQILILHGVSLKYPSVCLVRISLIFLSLSMPVCSLLQIFFDGIEDQFAAGVKPEEIGYRLKYSKAELKKCIREYPGKEVCPF